MIASIIDVSVKEVNLSVVRILRLLRTLRPLRFISHNKSMKLLVTALLESVSGIINVLIVVVLIWMMFAILGINLLRDKMKYCHIPVQITDYSIYQVRQSDCSLIPGATWSTYDTNMDNIGSSMLTLFILSTLEGWPNYMHQFLDATTEGPVVESNPWIYIYFIIYIFVGTWFLLNLFIGVIFLNFRIADKKAKNQYLTDEQARWIEVQRLMLDVKPNYASIRAPHSRLRKKIWLFVDKKPYLEYIVMPCIILNIVTMAMAYEGAPLEYDNALFWINMGFSGVFLIEAALKLLAYGAKGYFESGWNQFDFFVVCASIVDTVLFASGNGMIKFLKVGPQLARIFRILRVTRLLRLIKAFQGLQQLIQVAIFALPALMNVIALLFLSFFIFSILGCYLFNKVK